MWKQLKVALYTGWTIVVRVQMPRVAESLPHCGKLTVDSFHMLLGVYYSSSPATSVVSWLRYTLNKLDTSSNGSMWLETGYVTTVLGFLNCVDPLDLVSNYYIIIGYYCGIIYMYLKVGTSRTNQLNYFCL